MEIKMEDLETIRGESQAYWLLGFNRQGAHYAVDSNLDVTVKMTTDRVGVG
jgi:hypothetical protein